MIGEYQLGMAENSISKLPSRDADNVNVDFVEGRCTTACSSESLSGGSQQLRAGFISRGNLLRRLGNPNGITHVAGSTVWIYDVPLDAELSNGREQTKKAFLYVLFEEYGDLFYLNRFEMTIEGAGRERWPSSIGLP
jgi:hypothetical protein